MRKSKFGIYSTLIVPLYIGAGGAAVTFRILAVGLLLVPALLLPTTAITG